MILSALFTCPAGTIVCSGGGVLCDKPMQATDSFPLATRK